jgi:group I intron endonuclease
MIGIYKIINEIDGKYYIGSSKNLLVKKGDRLSRHKTDLKLNRHINKKLQNAYNKYGIDNFHFIVIEECEEKELLIKEQLYLNEASKNKNNCYNLSFIAGKVEMNDDVKNKIRKSRLGMKLSENAKNILRKIHKGKAIRKKGFFMSDEQKNNIGFANCNKNIYTFENTITKEIFTGIQRDFKNKYNLQPSKISNIISGKRKHHKNWIFKKQD